MHRTLITTVLAASLIGTFDFSTVSAADLAEAGLVDATIEAPAPPVEAQLIGRGFRGGGGVRRGGGGGFRRGGGGMRRSGARSGGYRASRSSGARRSGSARRTSSGRRSSAHASTRHASSRSSHSTHASKARSSARSSHQSAKTSHGKQANHAGRNGHGRGRGGGYYGGGGAAWDASAIVDGGYLRYVVPVFPDIAPVVVDPRPAVITLVNPMATHTPVFYALGGEQYSLEAGQEIGHDDGTQVITFNRGGAFGEMSYTLAPGTYEFVGTDHGWDLHSVSNEVALKTTVASDNDAKATETNEIATNGTATTVVEETTSKKEAPLSWLGGR
jgi:hypothetical protein